MADTKVSALTPITTLDGDELIPIVDTPGGTPASRSITVANLRYPHIAARVYHSTDQTITSGSTQYVAFDSERYDRGSCHNTSSNTSRLTAPVTGIYTLTFSMWVTGTPDATVYAGMWVNRGGSDQIAFGFTVIGADGGGGCSLSTDFLLTATNYVEIGVYCATASVVVKNDRKDSPEFTMRLVGP